MKQARVLTQSDFKRLMSMMNGSPFGPRNRAAVMISHYAGLRVGEIAALRIGDVFDDRGVRDCIMLAAAITKSGEARVVFVCDKLRLEMERYAASLPDKARSEDRPLFTTRLGGAFTPNSLCQLFLRLYAAAGIKGASSHSGRRWFITNLATKGATSKVIMTLAGHKNLTTPTVPMRVRQFPPESLPLRA